MLNIDYIICHYNEICLKGNNRRFFEEKLIENIKRSLDFSFFQSVKRISGRLIVKLTAEGEKNQEKIKESLKNIFGLAYFSLAREVEQNPDVIQQLAFEILKQKKFESFKIFTQRSKKDFYLTSPEINEKVGEFIVKKLNKKVDLENPDVTFFIEIVENSAFVYLEKNPGPGGLPVGVSGKALCLLSGGIDSSVAAFYGLRRGLNVIFCHFYTGDEKALEKIKKLAGVLNKYQFKSKLYSISFLKFHQYIFKDSRIKSVCLLCRRMMFRLAEILAEKEKCSALITGENLGQVASQTIENIRVIEEITPLPVLRPLIGQDKQEIISKAREIGTYTLSILPENFYCQAFLPKHPTTKAKLEEVKALEKNLSVKDFVKNLAEEIKMEEI